jgi:hypothetical protein
MNPEFKPVQQRHDKVLSIGGGESLIDFDINQLKDFDGVIITVNNVVYHLPRVEYWITVDPMRNGKPQVAMMEKREGVYYFCAYPDLEKTPLDRFCYQTVEGIHYLERIVPENKITTGDSCYGALGLAYHFEASKIIMLGVDAFGYGHWYDKKEPYNRSWGRNFGKYLERIPLIYQDCVEQFKRRGSKIVLGSPHSPIDCFEKMSPDRAYHYFD